MLKEFVDYDINAPVINWMRNNVTPFSAYTYRIVPFWRNLASIKDQLEIESY